MSRPKRQAALAAEHQIFDINENEREEENEYLDPDAINLKKSRASVTFALDVHEQDAVEFESSEEENIQNKERKTGRKATGKKAASKKSGGPKRGTPKPKAKKEIEVIPVVQLEARRRPTKDDESMKEMLQNQFASWSLSDHLQAFGSTRYLVYADGKPFCGW